MSDFFLSLLVDFYNFGCIDVLVLEGWIFFFFYDLFEVYIGFMFYCKVEDQVYYVI